MSVLCRVLDMVRMTAASDIAYDIFILSYLILSLLAVCWRECYLFLDHRTICKQWWTASSSARQLFSYFAEYLSSCSCIIAFLFKDAFTSKMHSLQALSFPLYPSYQSSCLTFNHDSPIFPSRNHIPYSGECGLRSSSISASLLTSAPSNSCSCAFSHSFILLPLNRASSSHRLHSFWFLRFYICILNDDPLFSVSLSFSHSHSFSVYV